MVHSGREVVVHTPAAVGYYIAEFSACLDIVLIDRIFAYIAAAFAFTGEKSYPFKLIIFSAVVAVVFNMVPYAVGDFQKLVTVFVGVVYAVALAAKLNPPEIC